MARAEARKEREAAKAEADRRLAEVRQAAKERAEKERRRMAAPVTFGRRAPAVQSDEDDEDEEESGDDSGEEEEEEPSPRAKPMRFGQRTAGGLDD